MYHSPHSLHAGDSVVFSPSRITRHLLFWAVMLLWTTAVYEHTFEWNFYFHFLRLNLLRLPLIAATVYGIVYGLIPSLFLRGRERIFFLATLVAIFIFTVLDRLVCGSGLSELATADSGLRYVFFNPVAILRNDFVFLSVLTLFTLVKFRASFRQKIHAVEKEAGTLSIKARRGEVNLDIGRIDYLAKDENYVVIHCAEERYLVRSTLKRIVEQLPEGFVNVHRSYVINPACLRAFTGKEVLLASGIKLPVSRGARARVRGVFTKA